MKYLNLKKTKRNYYVYEDARTKYVSSLFNRINYFTPVLVAYLESKKYFIEVSADSVDYYNPGTGRTYGVSILNKDGSTPDPSLNFGGFYTLPKILDELKQLLKEEIDE